ncbi:MAG: bL21 family ribosomal protein, partial [Mangrovicoccus sp.]|nr:bL21 family ribosomal protein [Mangrovicoccus sp.]
HKRRRKHSSKRTRGHRQKLTLVRVTGIAGAGSVAAAAAAEPVPAE